MAEKTKPCALETRHRWTFVRNRICTYTNVGDARISQRGVYRCACGAKKIGAPRINMQFPTPQENVR